MNKSANIAFKSGAIALASWYLASYFHKKNETVEETVCDIVCGCASTVVLGAVLKSLREQKESNVRASIREVHKGDSRWLHIGKNMEEVDFHERVSKDYKKLDSLVSKILSDIGVKWIPSPHIGKGNYYKGLLSKNIYNKLGEIDSLPGREKFWFACAGGTVSIRNEWVSPRLNPNPYSIAKDLIKSGLINFYKDENGERISDAAKLGPLLKTGDVICFKYWNRDQTINREWHTATVLSNNPLEKILVYLEFHGVSGGLPRVEVWKINGYDFGRFSDERLYGAGSW